MQLPKKINLTIPIVQHWLKNNFLGGAVSKKTMTESQGNWHVMKPREKIGVQKWNLNLPILNMNLSSIRILFQLKMLLRRHMITSSNVQMLIDYTHQSSLEPIINTHLLVLQETKITNHQRLKLQKRHHHQLMMRNFKLNQDWSKRWFEFENKLSSHII